MPNGIIQFVPVKSFVGPPRSKLQELQEEFGDSPPDPQSTAQWPVIQIAIRRGGLFVIETQTPDFRAMLRFDPEHPEAGDYEIRRRDAVEIGRIEKVQLVAANETSRRLSMLTPFPNRFAVHTVELARPYKEMVWLVGLREFQTVDEAD